MRFVGRFLKSQRGQALVEYAYMLLFVALAAVAAFATLGINVLSLLDSYSRAMP